MDAKITKTRLAQTLSYDWVKVVAAALAVIFVWVLIFTWTATRITNTQKYVIHNYFGVSLGDGYYDSYPTYGKGKVFSYEVFEVDNVNVNQDQQLGYQLLETRFAVGEGDAMLIADIDNPTAYYDKDGNQLNKVEENTEYFLKSYLETFARTSYSRFVTRLDDEEGKDGIFTQLRKYLEKFYTVASTAEKTYGGFTFTVADFDNDSLNEEAVIQEFTNRAKANKDKRFKTQAEWEKGYADEIARIKAYQVAYEQVFSYLDEGYIALTAWNYDLAQSAPWIVKGGAYSVNLCPKAEGEDKPKMDSLKNDFFYRAGEEGKTYTTAENMNLLFLELEGLDKDFQYESILLLNDIVTRHAKKA
jgi:hypothetical protein